MELGYWGIKGRGAPLLMYAKYLGLDVNFKMYKSPDEWKADKENGLGMDFPNIPYIKDGDFCMSETAAIPHYLAAKAGKQDTLGKGVDAGRHQMCVLQLIEVDAGRHQMC